MVMGTSPARQGGRLKYALSFSFPTPSMSLVFSIVINCYSLKTTNVIQKCT